MNSSEIIASLRMTAFIGDAAEFPDYTDARCLIEINDRMTALFSDIVTKARSGYWLKETISNTVVGRGRYRIPPRATTGGLEKVELAAASGGTFFPLDEIPAEDTELYEGPQSGNPGMPAVFTVQGDQIEMFPTPSLVVPLRLTYYVRPSALVTQQSSSIGGTVRGQITVVNTTTRQLTVNVVPFDQLLAVPAAITSAVQRIDVVHPNGWHELALVDAAQTLAGSVFTVGGTQDMSDIEVGDFVRVAEQTDWPCLPDEFHRSLADVAAVKLMIELNMAEKAAAVASSVSNDLERFRSLLLPRVKSQPKTIPISLRSRGGGRRYWLT